MDEIKLSPGWTKTAHCTATKPLDDFKHAEIRRNVHKLTYDLYEVDLDAGPYEKLIGRFDEVEDALAAGDKL